MRKRVLIILLGLVGLLVVGIVVSRLFAVI